MDKQENEWFINIMTMLNIIMLLFLLAESGGQTPGDCERQNIAGNLKGIKQNFQLSHVVNILVSVTGTCKVLYLLLHFASHRSHD